MDTMQPRQRFLTALDGGQPDRVPIFDWINSPEIYHAELGFSPPGFDPYLAACLNKSLGLDAVWVPGGGMPGMLGNYTKNHWLDASTFVDEWQVPNRVSEDSWPLAFSLDNPVKTAEDWAAFRLPDPTEPWRLQYARDAIAEARRDPANEIAVVAGLRGPFSTAFILMGLPAMSYALLEDPSTLESVFASASAYWAELGVRLIRDAGVDAVVLHEDMGANRATFLSPRHMRQFVLPHLRHLVDTLRAAGGRVILHSCGNINKLLPDIAEMGFLGLNNIQRSAEMDLAQVKSGYGDRLCPIGNVDATNLLPYASAEEIETAVVECLSIGAPGGRYILASDHSMHGGIPVANVRAFISAGKKYGAYPLDLPNHS